jgi:chaperone modulatory protein CbpM
METEQLIAATEFCYYHNIELSFISSLNESGLIDITKVEEKIFVPVSQLKHLEKLMRLKEEMDINVEGIETITYLLQRMNEMQQHILQLNNKLAFYENE